MSLQLIPLSDETIAKHNYHLGDLWMIKNAQDILGPFHTSQIQEEVAKKNPILDHCTAYNLESEKWQSLYSWPIFQRRLPQLVPVKDLLTENDFYVLKNGHKTGPFTTTQIQQDIHSGKLNFNDLITNTDADEWIKICEHGHFDRREQIPTNLPGRPANNIFEHEDQKIVNLISKKQIEKEQEDALVGLAFIVHGNDKGQMIPGHNEVVNTAKQNIHSEARKKITWSFSWDFFTNLKENKTLVYSSTSIGIIVLFFTVMNSINSSFDSNQDIQFTRNKEKQDIRLPETQAPRAPATISESMPEVRPEVKRLKPVRKERLYKKANRASTSKLVRKKAAQENEYQHEGYPYEDEEPIVHRYPEDEETEMLDIEDPAVREQISRELASDLEDKHLTDRERKEIEREINSNIDDEAERYLEDQAEEYEQVSDFE